MSRTTTPSSAPAIEPGRLWLVFSERSAADRSARWACATIFAVTLCQVLFLLVGCDWDFSGDEAEFWAWSRRLDWSYFARGPLIAWLIRLSTETLGPLSQWLTGSLMFAARFPAIVLGALFAWGVFRLASLTTGSPRTALLAVLLLPAVPVLMIGGVLINCDTPLVCCWTWAAVWTFRALHAEKGVRTLIPEKGVRTLLRGRPDACAAKKGPGTFLWIAAGLIGALGVMAKYTMLAFPVCVGVFLLGSAPHRRHLKQPGFWVMSALCIMLGLAPIVAWNALHDWVGFGQLADRVGLSSRSAWGGIQPVLTFLGGEFAALGGVWWVVGAAALAQALVTVTRTSGAEAIDAEQADSPRSKDRAGLIFLLCLWGVIWTACLVASLLGETEVNWMAPGYVPLLILIGMRLESVFRRGGARPPLYVAAWCVSLALVVAIHHTEWFFPMFARWVPASTKGLPAPLRRIDPTCRMRGHKPLALEVAKRFAMLETEGASPFVLTPTYALTSTLSFYLPGQPETYCLSWNYGMTSQPVNQHDLWHPNPRHDQSLFRGRPAIIVDDSNMPPNFANQMLEKGVFGQMDSNDRVFVRENGVVVGTWDISVCRDYKGLAGYKQNPIGRKAVAASGGNRAARR